MSFFRLARPRLLSAPQNLLIRLSSTASPASSPVLSRLRPDLMTAMRAKDTARLNVLRTLLAEITNASKTSKPIDSDITLFALLNKQIAGSEKAIEDFESAKRPELVEKEKGQIEVLKSYQDDIPRLSREDTDALCEEVVAELKNDPSAKVNQGTAMKAVIAKVGSQVHDTRYIAEKLKELTS